MVRQLVGKNRKVYLQSRRFLQGEPEMKLITNECFVGIKLCPHPDLLRVGIRNGHKSQYCRYYQPEKYHLVRLLNNLINGFT